MQRNYNPIPSDKALVLDFARKGGGKKKKGKKISERELACHRAVLLGRKFMPFAENGRRRGVRAKRRRKKGAGRGVGNGISKIEPGHFAEDNIIRLSLYSVK